MAEEVDFEEEVSERVAAGTVAATAAAGGDEDDRGGRRRGVKVKGRGHERRTDADDRYDGRGGVFERIEQSEGPGPLQCTWFTLFNVFNFNGSYFLYISKQR